VATVVVADDHSLIREGVVRVLERGGHRVLAVAADAVELLVQVDIHRPDVVVTDIEMPPSCSEDGLAAAVDIRGRHPETAVIVLSQYLEGDYALTLVGDRPQGVGYLLKEKIADPDILNDAVRRVSVGESVLDPDAVTCLVRRGRPHDPLNTLTPRERDVLGLMAEGHSNTGIAARLAVTVPAVERHVTNIFVKLGLSQANTDQHRRVLAVLTFLRG